MKLKQLFESQFPTSKEEVEAILRRHDIENYTINDDLTVDVDGDVFIRARSLTKLPLKFGKVSGSFKCSQNNLTSLEGSPKEVGDSFDCTYNKLTSLRGGPQEVSGDFWCRKNQLTSLDGIGNVGGRIYGDLS